jgi:hypothetical protein
MFQATTNLLGLKQSSHQNKFLIATSCRLKPISCRNLSIIRFGQTMGLRSDPILLHRIQVSPQKRFILGVSPSGRTCICSSIWPKQRIMLRLSEEEMGGCLARTFYTLLCPRLFLLFGCFWCEVMPYLYLSVTSVAPVCAPCVSSLSGSGHVSTSLIHDLHTTCHEHITWSFSPSKSDLKLCT